jgi:hypothetical protein
MFLLGEGYLNENKNDQSNQNKQRKKKYHRQSDQMNRSKPAS